MFIQDNFEATGLAPLTLLAPAKINLRLEILGKRPDGYHEIQTIFQKVGLYDVLDISLQSQPDTIQVSVQGDSGVPAGEDNLVYRAAALLMKNQNIGQGVRIHITKNIPAGAGLGGGSSDAAAALEGLNSLLSLGLPTRRIQELSQKIGADVPFFLSGFSTALATGTGEELSPLTLNEKVWFLIVSPDFSVSTAWAYQTFSRYKLLTKTKKNTTLNKFIRNIDQITSLLYNDFEQIVIPEHPEIEAIKNSLLQAGAAGSLMTGSGSSVFGVFPDRQSCERARDTLAAGHRCRAYAAQSL